MPAKCGRAVVDGLFSIEESHRLLSIAKKGLVKGGSNGGASILDLHSGALSKVISNEDKATIWSKLLINSHITKYNVALVNIITFGEL